jgi:fucose permease
MEQHHRIFIILIYLFIIGGWYGASLGVLIPYFSEASGHDETYFSFLFIVRSIAYALGSIAVKYLVHSLSTQKLLITYLAISSVSIFIYSLSLHTANLSIMIFISGFCIMGCNIQCFTIVIKLFEKDKPEFWVVLAGVGFGVGAFFAPIFTLWLQLHTLRLLAVLFAVTIPLLLCNPLP